MPQANTLTIDQLIAQLTKFPHDTKVYMSSDSEGNGYNTIGLTTLDYTQEDKALVIFPDEERLEVDEILPNWWESQE